MTKQEFRKLVEQKIDEGVMPSRLEWHDRPACMYRGCNGTQCAIGILLTDEDIDKHHIGNNSGFYDLPHELQARICLEGLTDTDMRAIQACHDACHSLDNFKNDFLRRLDALDCMKETVTP